MIERIYIDNYKSIQKARIALDKLNVLIGANGAGKSNFISFFELVRSLLDQNLGGYVLKQGGMSRLLYKGPKKSKDIKCLIDFDNTNAFYFILKPTINGKAYIEESGDCFNCSRSDSKKYDDHTLWNRTVWDKAVEESTIADKGFARAKYIQNYLRSFMVYHFHDTSATSPMREACAVNDNRFLRYDASNLAAFLYYLKLTDAKSFSMIESVVRSVAPYFKRFRLLPNAIDNTKIQLEWEENDSDDLYLDAHSFSDGTLRFIALATLLLQPHLPDTILIDEPELGLHPAAIQKLGALIKRASQTSQVIIATQSVDVINCFSIEDLMVVDREENQTVFKRLEAGKYEEWLQDYSVGEIWKKNIIGGRP